MRVNIDGIETPTIEEIQKAENESIKVLIDGDFSPPEIQEMFDKNSILHRPIPNADANLIKYFLRAEKLRLEIIEQSRLAVERAQKDLVALQKKSPAPKNNAEWTPPEPMW